LRRTVDHTRLDDRIDGDVAIGHVGASLQPGEAPGALEYLVEVAEGVLIRAAGVIDASARLGVCPGDVHVFDHTPHRTVRLSPRFSTAFAIGVPMARDCARWRKRARPRPPAALACDPRRRRIRARYGNGDRRAARQPRLRHEADAELLADRFLDAEAPELA